MIIEMKRRAGGHQKEHPELDVREEGRRRSRSKDK
jgi:hypothetical protein